MVCTLQAGYWISPESALAMPVILIADGIDMHLHLIIDNLPVLDETV